MSISVTSASYSGGTLTISGTRPAGLKPVTVAVGTGSAGPVSSDGTAWSHTAALSPPPSPPISISLAWGDRGYTFDLAGSKITKPKDSLSVGVTEASYNQAAGKVVLKGTAEDASITAVTVGVPGGGGSATVDSDKKWSYTEMLNPAPAAPIQVSLAAAGRVMKFKLAGSDITEPAMG